MQWQPAYGGSVLALHDQAGRIVATVDGPHPHGFMLTMLTPERATSLHPTLAEAQRVGERLQASAPFSYRRGRAGQG